ncbi:hypothetical protein PYW08_002780 [Mythimna loreyi]|uniref:Uncharacterized protein n=1 Tax=Mythimna loreyi TaxID=667449 RepID=A0ACC2QIU9_9NEOP|nr:hypothetical protein PYW08_002780 [Mythimna loreyi]
MSVIRSPPKELSGSAPNLSNIQLPNESNTSSSNITLRHEKRKRGDVLEEELKSFMTEMKNMMDSQNQKFTFLHSAIDEIKTQNIEISKAMDFMSEKYEEFKTKLEKSERQRTEHLATIKALESRVEQLERNARTTCIEIRNVPKNNQENKVNLIEMVKNIGTAIKTDITESDIKDIFRYYSKSSSKMPIIVEFTTVLKKEAVLHSIKKFKSDSKTILSTTHANIEGPKEAIYVSESLTAQSKRIFAMARKFASEHNYKFCWTKHGTVYLRKVEGTKPIRLYSEEDLNKLATTN